MKSQAHSRIALDFVESYAFVFRSSDWVANLAIGFASFLIAQVFGLAGFIAVVAYWGYQFAVLESLVRRDSTYARFDFSEFGDYLHRAGWPFLLTFPLWIAWTMQLLLLYLVFVFGLVIFLRPSASDAFVAYTAIGIPTAILLSAIGCLLVWGWAIPMTLRTSLTRKLREGFRFRWICSFIRRTWFEMLLAFCFLLATSYLVVTIGLLVGCVGAFLAQAWCFFANTHLSYQLYLIFLDRGGDEIQIFVPHPPAEYQPPEPAYHPTVLEQGQGNASL